MITKLSIGGREFKVQKPPQYELEEGITALFERGGFMRIKMTIPELPKITEGLTE